MILMSREELRNTQIGILDFLNKVCEENGINYFLTYGTLLGAIRHKGYIPWDDDIDVAMLRKDYDKLIQIFESIKNTRYSFECVENSSSCMYPFGKIIDNNTILYELGEDGVKSGVYIDVFVYDNAPEDTKKREKGFDKLDFYGRWRNYQLPLKPAPLSFKRIIVLVLRFLISVFLPNQFFTKKIVESARSFGAIESEYVCDFSDPYYYCKWVIEKKVFEELILVEFEGKEYKAPRQYDRWLKIQYGNYMKIPSLEEQMKSQHDIKAYLKKDCM